MKTVFIYALCEPGTRIIRYVGKAEKPENRLKKHWRSKNQKNHLGHWLSSLSECPSLLILKEVIESEWQEWEQRYIRCAGSVGFNLVNGTSGGEGSCGHTVSVEVKQKLRELNLGKKQSPETIAKKVAAQLGKKRTPEFCEQQRQRIVGKNHHFFGKHLSDEHRAKLSERLSGDKNPNYRGKKDVV